MCIGGEREKRDSADETETAAHPLGKSLAGITLNPLARPIQLGEVIILGSSWFYIVQVNDFAP